MSYAVNSVVNFYFLNLIYDRCSFWKRCVSKTVFFIIIIIRLCLYLHYIASSSEMINVSSIKKDLEGYDHDPVDLLSWDFPVGPQIIVFPGPYSNRELSKHESRALPIHQPSR
jgi:hypothetical protein